KVYRTTGYKIIATSTYSEAGINELKECLVGKVSVFAGPSGVGKSSLLNDIQSGLTLQTGELSEKIKRGKHTTRHSELIELDLEGWVVDTPGFTSLNIDFIDEDELGELYPEFEEVSENCKFANCLHLNEPGCNVLESIKCGQISKERYETYVYFINQIKEARRYKKW
ncbi:MAG: ribosome small subunit-dependent GTPase A, partial [Acidaminobacteraceae bacterium]